MEQLDETPLIPNSASIYGKKLRAQAHLLNKLPPNLDYGFSFKLHALSHISSNSTPLLLLLPQLHHAFAAVCRNELYAGLFKGGVELAECIRMPARLTILQTGDRHRRDISQLSKISNPDPQCGTRHTDLLTCYHRI